MQWEQRKTRGSSDPYYDLIEDFDLIIASFQTQYGIRLSRELRGMKWDEFKALLSGIAPDTPLGRIVAVRAEDDKEVLKHFSREQRRIRNEWRNRAAQRISEDDMAAMLEALKEGFMKMAGK